MQSSITSRLCCIRSEPQGRGAQRHSRRPARRPGQGRCNGLCCQPTTGAAAAATAVSASASASDSGAGAGAVPRCRWRRWCAEMSVDHVSVPVCCMPGGHVGLVCTRSGTAAAVVCRGDYCCISAVRVDIRPVHRLRALRPLQLQLSVRYLVQPPPCIHQRFALWTCIGLLKQLLDFNVFWRGRSACWNVTDGLVQILFCSIG